MACTLFPQNTASVTWDASIAANAQAWSDKCMGITHSFTPGLGENTYNAYATSADYLGSDNSNLAAAVDDWCVHCAAAAHCPSHMTAHAFLIHGSLCLDLSSNSCASCMPAVCLSSGGMRAAP
jgi:hypothetical protein